MPRTTLYKTKISKLNFLIYFKKYLIVRNEKMKDSNIETKLIEVISIFSEVKRLFIPNILTPARVGIDNKKEIFAASTLLKFKILAAVIVIPDLLTPGIREKI